MGSNSVARGNQLQAHQGCRDLASPREVQEFGRLQKQAGKAVGRWRRGSLEKARGEEVSQERGKEEATLQGWILK